MYRPATPAEVQQAGGNSAYLEDWMQARDYAEELFGPSVMRVQLVIDHNNDDGEESLYVMGAFYGASEKASYTPVEKDGYFYQRDELHRGWDAAGKELPLLCTIRNHYLYDAAGNDIDTPEFNNHDHWHMEFDFAQEPSTPVLYVKDDVLK